MNKPYTYLIGWTSQNVWYYGVRYSKNCTPSDLWTKYFTSSNNVKKYRKKYGEPDVIQIRKIFVYPSDAIEWEQKVLRRMKVVGDTKWINLTCGPAFRSMAGSNNPFYSKTHSEEALKKMKGPRPQFTPWNKGISFNAGTNNFFYGKTHSANKKAEWSKIRKGRVWINNGTNETLIDPNIEIMQGWIRGRLKG